MNVKKLRSCVLVFLFVGCVTPNLLFGQAGFDVKANYTKSEQMVAMRDGVKLFTIVYTPKDKSQKYPFLLFRTPYSIPPYGPDNYRARLGPTEAFDREGFIYVFQDVRGQYRSEGGQFIVMKPHKKNKKSVKDTDESSDTYDTIDWMLKNIPNNNGRVGQWGVSYPGWQTALGMIDAHPALKASSPQASPSDMWLGDDFHHNGAFRYMYTFNWLSGVARVRSAERDTTPVARNRSFNYGTPDGYNFFMNLGPVANVDKQYFKYQVPTWTEYMEHGDYDKYWQEQNVAQYMDKVLHPILNVGGWFDAEDFYGPLSIYYSIEKKNPTNKSVLVVGPWRHGGWNGADGGDALGDIRFGSKTGFFFQQEIQFPFFLYHLKGKGQLDLPEAYVFETGRNEWRKYDHWPPRNIETKNLYLHPDGKLSFTVPTEADNATDSYISDPSKPVPWSAETRTTQGALWMIEDQRFASRRPDVLVYQTDVLTEDITIAGPILASMQVSTTGTDADVIVKLIDVYPGNAPDNVPNPQGVRMGDFQMLLAAEVFRGKYRNSFEKPEPFVPGQVAKVEYDLHDKLHTFLPGHRIMVQVQSSWFPVIDRNPQKFVNIYRATESDFQKATISVHRSKSSPSHIKLNLLKK